MVGSRMPVRSLDMDVEHGVRYEGPVEAAWNELVESHAADHPEFSEYHLLGALIASVRGLDEGRIMWVEQTEITQEQVGQSRLAQPR